MSTPRTVVDLVDTREGACHCVRTVRINGQEVRVAENGISVTFGPNEVTRVTVELLPDEVHFIKQASPSKG